MPTDIRLVFHNKGLRSYIEVDLCAQCPRQDDKGCCGYYSPVFYPLDLYYLQQNAPQVLDLLWKLPHLTTLDHSVTINSFPDSNGGYYCQFHRKEGGCQLQQEWRESVCRHFVCPGIDWQSEPELAKWKDFFADLETSEIKLNQAIADQLSSEGLSLRYPEQRARWFNRLTAIVSAMEASINDQFLNAPPHNKAIIARELKFGTDWPL